MRIKHNTGSRISTSFLFNLNKIFTFFRRSTLLGVTFFMSCEKL